MIIFFNNIMIKNYLNSKSQAIIQGNYILFFNKYNTIHTIKIIKEQHNCILMMNLLLCKISK